MMFSFWSVKQICTLKAKWNFQEWKYRQLRFQGIFCFDSVITVVSDTMLFMITHYAGEDLKKCNFAWMVMFAFWSVKKICTLKANRNFQECNNRQLPFQGVFCFDSVITVSPAMQCCLQWFLSPNFSRPTSSLYRSSFSEGKRFLWFRTLAYRRLQFGVLK